MFKNVMLVAALAVSSLVSAQDIYEYKGFGMIITYEFTDNNLKVTNHKGETETVEIISVDKSEKINIYISGVFKGKSTKYTLVKKGRKNKYVMLMDVVDDFTKEVAQASLTVSKITN